MSETSLANKKQQVEVVAEQMKNAASSVIVEYRGLSVAEITELRRRLRAEEIEFKVYKNSLVQFAAKKLGYDQLTTDLTGPNAFAFSADAVAPSRVLAEFAKKHRKLILKAGVVDGKVVNAEEIAQLAKLPNKDGMISMLLSCLQAPIRSMACVLQAVADQVEQN